MTESELACHCRYCDPVPGQERSFDEPDRKVMADVAAHGWHVLKVHDYARSRGWVFSVGMWHTFRQPELVVAGLPEDHCHWLINDIGDRVRGGLSLHPYDRLDDLLTSGLALTVREVDPSWYQPMFGYALWFARRPPLPFLQVVWPDATGRFPWEDSFDRGLRAAQPWLWIPGDQHPPGAWSGLMAPEPWPFDDAQDTAVFTTKRVTDDGATIRFVYHDEDGVWQFIDDGPTEAEDAALVHLVHIVGAEPAIASLADLPRGWMATRDAASQSWARSPRRDRS